VPGSGPLIMTSDSFGSIEAQQLWFWRVVQQTLGTVFNEARAASMVQDYRREVDRKATGLEQVALYHSSPLSVAADLAGWSDEISDRALETYLSIQREAARDFGLSMEGVGRPSE
jgi:hypothetical protein